MKNQFQEEKKRNFATNRKEFPKRRARRDDEMKMYGGLPYVSEVRLQKSRVSSFPFVYLDFLVEFDSHYARVQRALTNIIALRSRQISRRCLETLIASREMRQRDQKIHGFHHRNFQVTFEKLSRRVCTHCIDTRYNFSLRTFQKNCVIRGVNMEILIQENGKRIRTGRGSKNLSLLLSRYTISFISR